MYQHNEAALLRTNLITNYINIGKYVLQMKSSYLRTLSLVTHGLLLKYVQLQEQSVFCFRKLLQQQDKVLPHKRNN